MTSVNAFATLLEAFFNIFLQTYTHTDTKALLYPCCACTRGNYQEPTCKPPTQARVQEAQKDLVTLGKFLYVPSQQPWFWVDESRSVFYHLKGYSHLINCCSRLPRPACGRHLASTLQLAIINNYLQREFGTHLVRNVIVDITCWFSTYRKTCQESPGPFPHSFVGLSTHHWVTCSLIICSSVHNSQWLSGQDVWVIVGIGIAV